MNRQGKAIVEFTTVDQANSFLEQCQKELICLENGLKLHSNYCKLVQPHSKEDDIPEMKNVELPGNLIRFLIIFLDVTAISSSEDHPYPFHFCEDRENTDNLLYIFNQYLSSSYDTIQIFELDPSSPFSLFLEHHCFGDCFAFTVVCEENQSWDVIIPHANGLNKYHCLNECFCIEGKTRFCQNLLISSQTKGYIIVISNVIIKCYHSLCRKEILHAIVSILIFVISVFLNHQQIVSQLKWKMNMFIKYFQIFLVIVGI